MSEDFAAQLAGFQPGTLVAGYRLEAQVGAGGMAVVFRARDERLGRLVALKILAPALASDQMFRRRFVAESRAAAAVDDPHIIPIYEAGEASGALFIAMRFVKGGDLRLILQREGALPPERAAGFISPVASALDAAHGTGLVHRDVKPANILVDARPGRPDHVYLSDFGVSKGAMSSVSLTAAGQFLGTPDYSAPEQIQGLRVDGRVDQYALACVAYQLLTGALPFERDQGMAVLFAHLSQPPPSLGAGFPRAADQVVARALAKVPEKRYKSCQDFADALREALGVAPYISGGPVSAAAHQPPRISGQQAKLSSSVPAKAGTTDHATAATVDSVLRVSPFIPADQSAPSVITASRSLRPPETTGESVGPIAKPWDSAADANAAIGIETGLAAKSADAIPSGLRRSHRAYRKRSRVSQAPGRRRWSIVTTSLVVLLAVIIGGGYIAWRWTQDQYYVAANTKDQVVIYRGVNQKIAGVTLSSQYQLTTLQLDQVPSNYQQTVKTAYATGSLAQVRRTVDNISSASKLCQQQYTALAAWQTKDQQYLAKIAAAQKAKQKTTDIAKPGPQPPAAGATCPSSGVFGIPASALPPGAS